MKTPQLAATTRLGWWIVLPVALLAVLLAIPALAPTPDEVAAPALEAKLNEQVSFQSKDEHLENIASMLAQYTDVPIAVDLEVVQPKAGPQPGNTYVSDGIVKMIAVENKSLREGLYEMLHPMGLTFTIKNGGVWITSRES